MKLISYENRIKIQDKISQELSESCKEGKSDGVFENQKDNLSICFRSNRFGKETGNHKLS